MQKRNSIQNKIIEFYNIAEVENYKPISFGKLDTVRSVLNIDGSLVRITGTIIHQLTLKDITGATIACIDTFDVTIFKNDVIVIPRGYYN